MTQNATPVVTGKAAEILAAATAGKQLATVADKAPEQEFLQGTAYPRYQLPISPCTVDFGTHRRMYPDGIAQADDAAEEAVLLGMAKVGNIHRLDEVSIAPKFAAVAPR